MDRAALRSDGYTGATLSGWLRAWAGLAVCGALIAPSSTATTQAYWTDSAEVSAARTRAATVVARPLQCAGGPSLSKTVTWEAFTDHPLDGVGFYTVRVNGTRVTPAKNGTTYSVTVDLALVTLLLPVAISVRVWDGSAWAQVSEITLGRSLLGLSLGFTCP